MNNIFRILKRDIKRLFSNPIAAVVVVGICVIPSLYAWFNIAANWDPYSNTSNIAMAVANEDEGANQELLGEINVGDMLVDELHTNEDLDWEFVDKQDAIEGVHSGKYYGAVIIPTDFSCQMTSFLDGVLGNPQINYYRNEKLSAVANKVTDTAASTIEEQVNEHFVARAMSVIVEKLQALGYGVDTLLGGMSQGVGSDVMTAANLIGDARTATDSMDKTIDATYAVIDDSRASMGSLADSMPLLAGSIDKTNTLLGDTRTSVNDFTSSLSSVLGQGMGLLGSASSKANAAIGELEGDVHVSIGHIDAALAIASSLNDINQDIILDLDRISQILPEDQASVLLELKSRVETTSGQTNEAINNLKTTSSNLNSTVTSISDASGAVDNAVQNGITTLNDAQSSFQTGVVPQLNQGLDKFVIASGDLSGVCIAAGPTIMQANDVLGQLKDTLLETQVVLKQVSSMLEEIQTSLTLASTDIAALQGSQLLDNISKTLNVDAEHVGEIVSSPVNVDSQVLFSVKNYGSAVAPFYTNLALWVGGFVLVAILKQEVDDEGISQLSATQAYLSRWLLFVLLGIVQGLIASVGDLILGIQCVEPVAFVLGSMAISIIYVSIIYALAITFKHIGKGVAVLLVILQIPGSSGMYPIEMMPEFFQALNPLLPFTYGINLMRECIAGFYGTKFWFNLGVLLIFMAISFVLGILARPRLINLNRLFDQKLSESEVMLAEQDSMKGPISRTERIAAILAQMPEMRSALRRHGAWIDKNYQRLIQIGVGLVTAVAIMFFILMATMADKLVMLAIWVGLVIAVDAYFVVIEYLRAKYLYFVENDRKKALNVSAYDVNNNGVDIAETIDEIDTTTCISNTVVINQPKIQGTVDKSTKEDE